MKKLLSIFVCLVMCLGLSLNAFAGGVITEEERLAEAAQIQTAAARSALPSGLSIGKTYYIRSMASTTSNPYMLNVWGGFDTDGTRIDMYKPDHSIDQRFKIVSSGNYFKIVALCTSNKVLDAYRPLKDGCTVDVYTGNDDGAQQLVIEGNSSSGYTICLASTPNLALTAVSLSDDGAVRFKTKTGAANQRWSFEQTTDTLAKHPSENCQNKSNWCWAAAAKIVGIHNGGGLKSGINKDPQQLTNTAGLHKTFYGYNSGKTKYYADGVQYAIVMKMHQNDQDLGGSVDDTTGALEFVSKNNVSARWGWNKEYILTDDLIADLQNELNHERYVIGCVSDSNGGQGHQIVVKDYDSVTGEYLVFNPWNGQEITIKGDDLFFNYNYKYLDNTRGKMKWFFYCR